MFEIRRYSPALATEWNDFVSRSKNSTFLFDRRYMDYHADRFDDHSMLFYREGKLFALLPANITIDEQGLKALHSHQGLTYGGLIMTTDATAADIVTLFELLNRYLKDEGICRVVYKAVPWIYHTHPAEEDLYALFKVCRARLIGRDISSAIPLDRPLKWSTLRRRGVKKAQNNGITVIACENIEHYKAFWKVLEDNLVNKYGVHPVHSLDEMLLLKERFPENIRLYAAIKDNEVLAGTVLYVTPRTIHAQYISASPIGKKLGALDVIYDVVLNHDFRHAFFDFGRSTEEHGTILNTLLIHQKEGFGGRAVCYDTYEWDV